MSKVDTSMAGYTWPYQLLYRIGRGAIAVPTKWYTRMRVEGFDRLPEAGGYLFAPSHRSYIDTPLASAIQTRRMRFMGKDSMWKYPRLGRLFSALGAFPVTRGSADREALKRCVDILRAGEPLVIFPEGERKDGPVIQPLFDGVAFVAAKADVPIVPVGIGGSAAVMPRHVKLPRPKKVVMKIGHPFRVEVDERGRASRAALAAATERLHVEIQELFDEAQAAVGES